MAFDDTTPTERALAQLHGDLPSAQVYRFPDSFVMRPQPGARGDQVAVTHRGETTIYASPEALAAALRADDPVLAAKLNDLRRLQDEALDALDAAQAFRSATRQLKAQAQRRLEAIGLAILLAAAFAVAIVVVAA